MRVHPQEVQLVDQGPEAAKLVPTDAYKSLRAELTTGDRVTERYREALKLQLARQERRLMIQLTREPQ